MSVGQRVIVVHPGAEDRPPLVKAVARPARLDGAVVGLVDNARTNSDRFMGVVGRLLERSGAGGVLIRRKPNPSVPLPDDALDDLLKRCGVIVHGVAD
jgi:hypothetical protein